MLIKGIDRLHNLETAQGLEKGKQSKMVTETFKSIISQVAYTVDELPINNRLNLEEKMYHHCKNVKIFCSSLTIHFNEALR
jgi:hypothetical protein